MASQVSTVFFKEMKCLFRDRKSFIIGMLIPFFLTPLMIFLTGFSGAESQKIPISVSSKNSCFFEFLKSSKNLEIKDVDDPYTSLSEGKTFGHVIIDDDLDEKILKSEDFKINTDYVTDSSQSAVTLGLISICETNFRKVISGGQIENKEQLYNIVKENSNDFDLYSGSKVNYFLYLMPILSILYLSMASCSASSQLSVAEKERGTWETLLSCGIERKSLIVGKVLASSLMAVMSAVFTVLGLYTYLTLSPDKFELGIAVPGFLMLLVVFSFLAVFASSAAFILGLYSKSSREAEIYFIPFCSIFTLPTFFSSFIISGNLGILGFLLPVVNLVSVIFEVLSCRYDLLHLLIAVLSTAFYSFLFLKIAVKLSSKESIIFRV